MQAELVIDLDGLGSDISKALGRSVAVMPSLSKLAAMWRALGVDVTAMHLITPGYSIRSRDHESFSELHASTWWTTESVFVEDEDFEASLHFCAIGDTGPIGLDSLVVATALHRSDALLELNSSDDTAVIVMSNSSSAAPAVTHARGVPVMLAGTVIPDSGLSHARLDLSWMGMLTNRFAPFQLSGIELRNGRPWSSGVAVCTPYLGLEGRDVRACVLPSFAASIAIFDPEYFQVINDDVDARPDAVGVAAVVQTLGLGELVHVEVAARDIDCHLTETTLVAAIYRYAHDHPDAPIVVASARPGVILATSDLDTFSLENARRFLRLCLPHRNDAFEERALAGRRGACRVVVERTLSEPMFAEGDERTINLNPQTVGSAEHEGERSPSPTLVLYTNPNTVKDDSTEWRRSTQRRFLLLGAEAIEAVPADAPDGQFLPVSLGACTDFQLRRPRLRPGCVVEGVLSEGGDRWIVVSDPIERRRTVRSAVAQAA